MNFLAATRYRYTAKAYDATRRIPDAQVDELLESLRHSPSSVNSQPWHFVVASDAAGKARIAKATDAGFAYNTPKVTDASHVIVFAARTELPAAHTTALLDQEEADGRFRIDGARAGQHKSRQGYIDLHRFDQKDLQHWMEKQVYLALGTLLVGAASLEIDATPMEGFDAGVLDAELGLRERGYTAVVLCALGYRAADDFNAGLPKSRLPASTVITRL
ncbi:MAG: oxygen-insensitive NAD(P)H nitroreductase [Variovorax paradoxus]|uniref:Oxygen-insensitive NAD(P)H nitroreductase n=1 Tax=Variovorax paradoxus TaxID=34073 RepID=A0A2W5P6E4_VARPD|nr:MAG: oxygen-insensitive NAD(P)H nitroreductase [Variovorax paradoxus]